MRIQIEVDEAAVKALVIAHLHAKLGEVEFTEDQVVIEVRRKWSKADEWERGTFRARLEVSVAS